MRRLLLLAAVLLLAVPISARPVDFCLKHPSHPHCTPNPTATATATATPSTPPSGGANVSGIVIPPPFPGYRRVHFTEFLNTKALGSGYATDTLQYLKPRPDPARDCTYTDSSGRGRYCGLATTSEHDGVLDQWLHTEDHNGQGCASGFTFVHDGSGECNYVSGPKWTLPDQADFVVSFVAKFDDIPGRKVAYLRWCGPKIGTAGYCEDNHPEFQLTDGTCKASAFHHHESRGTQNAYALCINPNAWHLFQMHVKPCQFVDFWLDGRLIGHATQYVICDSSYWVGQSETLLPGQTLPEPDNQGHILWDAYAVDLPQ